MNERGPSLSGTFLPAKASLLPYPQSLFPSTSSILSLFKLSVPLTSASPAFSLSCPCPTLTLFHSNPKQQKKAAMAHAAVI